MRRSGFDSKSPPAEPSGRGRRLWAVLPVCAGFAVFGAVVWMAYQDASLGPPNGEPPLIRAAPEAIKLPPDQTDEAALAAEQGDVGQLLSDAEPDQPERLLPLPEQPLPPPAGEPLADAGQPAREAAQGADGAAGMAALPSDAAQPATDRSVQEAEAALDRLLAEVTAVSEGTSRAGAGAAQPPEVRNRPAATPPENQGAGETPPVREETPASAPAAIAAAPAPAVPTPPPAPPQKPSAPAATAATGEDVRPAAATSGPANPEARTRSASTETAALSTTTAPPIASNGDFRIQLAAVRGQADARRAWELFARDLGPALRGIEPIFERADTANGVFYRVQVGPFASQEAAETLCEQLKQRNASCFVIRR
ncbi:MAG TPA: SPOR domain-containing protein [Candidatus Limnocylindrales bacterium]